MPDITETISLLDELRGKLNNGLIGDEFDDAVWEFVKAYDTILRQAALDGERYRKAGEILAFIFESAREELPDVGFFTKTKFDAVMSAFKEAMDGKNDQWIDWGMRDMEDYRQAVEQKEV